MDVAQSPSQSASALAKLLMREVTSIRTMTEQSLNAGWQNLMANWECARLAKESYTLELVKNPRYRDPRHLANFEFKGFSQSGEDGVIKEILQRIGTTSRQFLEIGVGPDLENNTTFLLAQGWTGLWLDCLTTEQIRTGPGIVPFLEQGKLKYLSSLVTPDNIRDILAPHLPPVDLDVMSLDLDRSTFHVWKAMDFLQARVLVLEYNSFYPPPIRWVVQEAPTNMDWTTMNFGASLASFTDLAEQRGYQLVHCSLTGVNAFYVRRDLVGDQFYLPADSLSFFEPYRSFLTYSHALKRSL